MAANIYELHAKAFKTVSAWVVVRNGDRVATIAMKCPTDGAGRLWAYVHWIGMPMARGHADGGGYDKASAACADAARRMWMTLPEDGGRWSATDRLAYAVFRTALVQNDGRNWERAVHDAEFQVWSAV